MGKRTVSLADLAGKPRRVSAGGETREVHPLTIDDLAACQAWVDGQFPDPFEIASRQIEKGDLPVAQQKYLLKLAMEEASKARRLIGTPEADALLASAEGLTHILYLSIRKGDPGFTEADARRFADKINQAEMLAARRAAGIDKVSSPPDPKAPSGASATSATTTAAPGPSTGGPSTTPS